MTLVMCCASRTHAANDMLDVEFMFSSASLSSDGGCAVLDAEEGQWTTRSRQR